MEWEVARTWGRGGSGTVGWSGFNPVDPQTNHVPGPYSSGFCFAEGRCDPNTNYNMRDICFCTQEVWLSTFCYEIDIDGLAGPATPQWYPVAPEEVVYQYTVWGRPVTTGVQGDQESGEIAGASISLRCESRSLSGQNVILAHYSMSHPGPITADVYNMRGEVVASRERDVWPSAGDEMTLTIPMGDAPSGTYMVSIRSLNAATSIKTIFTK